MDRTKIRSIRKNKNLWRGHGIDLAFVSKIAVKLMQFQTTYSAFHICLSVMENIEFNLQSTIAWGFCQVSRSFAVASMPDVSNRVGVADPPKALQCVFVALNPMAGSCTADDVRVGLERHFGDRIDLEIYETTGSDDEDVANVVRAAVAKGCDLAVA